MSRTFLRQLHLCPAAVWDTSLSERHGNPHFSGTGSGNFAAGLWIQRSDGAKTLVKTSFFSTGVGRCYLARRLPPVKDGQQDFFMGVGSWEMAYGRWHIGQ